MSCKRFSRITTVRSNAEQDREEDYMIVYIVLEEHFGDEYVNSVFSTREKAEQHIELLYGDDPITMGMVTYEILEMEVI